MPWGVGVGVVRVLFVFDLEGVRVGLVVLAGLGEIGTVASSACSGCGDGCF